MRVAFCATLSHLVRDHVVALGQPTVTTAEVYCLGHLDRSYH